MRLWHIDLLPYLSELQFKGQLRELVSVMHSWRDVGKTNHILINRVMDYSKNELVNYFIYYEAEYHRRYNKWLPKQWQEFKEFDDHVHETDGGYRKDWHTKEYLRVCVANLYEKWKYAKGKSKISDEEWQRILDGYKNLTGEDYKI